LVEKQKFRLAIQLSGFSKQEKKVLQTHRNTWWQILFFSGECQCNTIAISIYKQLWVGDARVQWFGVS